MMDSGYEKRVCNDLALWQKKMVRKPSVLNNFAKKVQTTINGWIPEKIHKGITVTIRQMIKGVLFGARLTNSVVLANASLQNREQAVTKKLIGIKKPQQ